MTASGERSRVALFRAREDANATAARLRRLGFSVASLPVIEIRDQPIQPRRARYDAIVATSAKAFRAESAPVSSSPLYLVGARTGRAAESRGWRLAAPPARDAAELTRTLAGALRPHAGILYIAGRDRKDAIERPLTEQFELEVIEAYAAEARTSWRASEAQALARCIAALHYSRRSASLAADLAKAAGKNACFLKLQHVCISQDVAEPLHALGARSLFIAKTPDEAALFQTLREELDGFASPGSSRI